MVFSVNDPKNRNNIGATGEHAVCADLRRQGYVAFQSAPDCSYDVVVDVGERLLRVQVKTVLTSKNSRKIGAKTYSHTPSWKFGLTLLIAKKGPDVHGHYMKFYEKGDYDILACVALDINKIAYLPFILDRTNVTVRSREYTYSPRATYNKNEDGNPYYFEDCSFEKVLADMV